MLLLLLPGTAALASYGIYVGSAGARTSTA
jgi:hypothetical protein